MPKRKLAPDTAVQATQLRRAGRSYREIGSLLRIDPRTAKGLAHRVEEAREREHWEAVSRQVDGRSLERHHRLLAQAARGLLRGLAPDPLESAPAVLDPGPLLQYHVAERLEGEQLPGWEGTTLGSVESEDRDTVRRWAARLVEALLEHEAILAEAWKRRNSAFRRLQQARQTLIHQAEGLLAQEGASS